MHTRDSWVRFATGKPPNNNELTTLTFKDGRDDGYWRWSDNWVHFWFIQYLEVCVFGYSNSPYKHRIYAFFSRAGPGPRGAMGTLSQYMLSSAATFGFFLAIGSVSFSKHTLI